MENQEKEARLSKIIKDVQPYSNLWLNDDFCKWRKNIVGGRLRTYQNDVLNTNPDSPEHKQATIRYQELKFITDDIFQGFILTEERMRKELKKIEKVG